jgi:GR25 family glycosyltransferase involved in LPS biosynthesis
MDFLKNIPTVVIHREQDTERDFLIHTFETKTGLELQRVAGMDGESLVTSGYPRKHPRDANETSYGNIGCTASHVSILNTFLEEPEFEYICIFEDDVELITDVSDIFEYIEYSWSLPDWDLLFLGVNEIVEGGVLEEQPLLSKVKRFWGTHAVILTRKAAQAILDTYADSLQQGFALPADWLYSFAIQQYNLTAYCPTDPLACVKQKEGLVSTCTGNLRLYSQ